MMLAASCLRPMLMDALVVRIAFARLPPACRRRRIRPWRARSAAGTAWLMRPMRAASAAVMRSPVISHSLPARIRRVRPDDRGSVSRREADAHVRIADLRGLDCEDDVAEEGKCRTEARRMAVDPGDDGLLAIEQGKDDALGLPRGLAKPSSIIVCIHGMSPPEQKARPAPVSTITSDPGSSAASLKIVASSARCSRVDGVEFIGSVEGQRKERPRRSCRMKASGSARSRPRLSLVRFRLKATKLTRK